MESNQRRLENAEKIINGLKEEVSHWINKLRELKEFRKTIEGSSILITAFLCIYPALLAEEHISIDAKLRESLKKWQFAIPENFNTFTFVKEEIMVDRDNWIKANR